MRIFRQANPFDLLQILASSHDHNHHKLITRPWLKKSGRFRFRFCRPEFFSPFFGIFGGIGFFFVSGQDSVFVFSLKNSSWHSFCFSCGWCQSHAMTSHKRSLSLSPPPPPPLRHNLYLSIFTTHSLSLFVPLFLFAYLFVSLFLTPSNFFHLPTYLPTLCQSILLIYLTFCFHCHCVVYVCSMCVCGDVS